MPLIKKNYRFSSLLTPKFFETKIWLIDLWAPFRKQNFILFSKFCHHSWTTCNSYLTNYGQKRSRNNIRDLGLSAKSGYIMWATVVYRWTVHIFVCSVRQKLANCTFIPNLRVKTLKFWIIAWEAHFIGWQPISTSFFVFVLFFQKKFILFCFEKL
jgi:hypothetical protein